MFWHSRLVSAGQGSFWSASSAVIDWTSVRSVIIGNQWGEPQCRLECNKMPLWTSCKFSDRPFTLACIGNWNSTNFMLKGLFVEWTWSIETAHFQILKCQLLCTLCMKFYKILTCIQRDVVLMQHAFCEVWTFTSKDIATFWHWLLNYSPKTFLFQPHNQPNQACGATSPAKISEEKAFVQH